MKRPGEDHKCVRGTLVPIRFWAILRAFEIWESRHPKMKFRQRSFGRRLRLTVGGAVLLAATACAAPTPYQSEVDGFGYAEQQIESNRYRVSFAGNSLTPRTTVQNYLLYRAAELTLQSGNDYFTVVDQDVERSTRYYGQGYSSRGAGAYRDDFFTSSSGRGMGRSTVTAFPIDEYVAQADIVMLKGEKPPSDVNAYDARDVLQRLESTIFRADDPAA